MRVNLRWLYLGPLWSWIWGGLAWIWQHMGWGWHGYSTDKLHYTKVSGERQSIKAYCNQYGISRKAAKKGARKAKMWNIERVKLRRALTAAGKSKREPVLRERTDQNATGRGGRR